MTTIEFCGVARLRAGVPQIAVEATTLGDALERACASLPGLMPDVVCGGELTPHFIAARNGGAFSRDGALTLRAGDRVLILGAQAGG